MLLVVLCDFLWLQIGPMRRFCELCQSQTNGTWYELRYKIRCMRKRIIALSFLQFRKRMTFLCSMFFKGSGILPHPKRKGLSKARDSRRKQCVQLNGLVTYYGGLESTIEQYSKKRFKFGPTRGK